MTLSSLYSFAENLVITVIKRKKWQQNKMVNVTTIYVCFDEILANLMEIN